MLLCCYHCKLLYCKNEELIFYVEHFPLVSSVKQLVCVKPALLPSAVAGIIHTAPFKVLAGISSCGRTTGSAHL